MELSFGVAGPPSGLTFGVDEQSSGVGGPFFGLVEPSFGLEEQSFGMAGPSFGLVEPSFELVQLVEHRWYSKTFVGLNLVWSEVLFVCNYVYLH